MNDVTQIFNEIDNGNRQSAASLLPMVHEELRKMACCQMALEEVGNTLSPNTNKSSLFC